MNRSTPFFESEVVQKCLEEIDFLQNCVMVFSQYADYATVEDQKENIQNLRLLLEKQRNMYSRCRLCGDDEGARDMMREVEQHFYSNGFPYAIGNMEEVFDKLDCNLDEIEESIQQYLDTEEL